MQPYPTIPDPTDELAEPITDQIDINTTIAAAANDTLPSITNILNRIPTAQMCAAVTLVLFDFGLEIYARTCEILDAHKPNEGKILADTLQAAAKMAPAYGSPIVAGLTHNLDLRPAVTVAYPHGPPAAVTSWQEEAARGLATISLELEARGFDVQLYAEPLAPAAWRLGATLLIDPMIDLRVDLGVNKLAPYALTIVKHDGMGVKPSINLTPGQQLSLGSLLHVVDAFLAGLKVGGPEPVAWAEVGAQLAQRGFSVSGEADQLIATLGVFRLELKPAGTPRLPEVGYIALKICAQGQDEQAYCVSQTATFAIIDALLAGRAAVATTPPSWSAIKHWLADHAFDVVVLAPDVIRANRGPLRVEAAGRKGGRITVHIDVLDQEDSTFVTDQVGFLRAVDALIMGYLAPRGA